MLPEAGIRARPAPKPPVCSRTSRGGRPEAEASSYNMPGVLPSPSPGQPPGLRFFLPARETAPEPEAATAPTAQRRGQLLPEAGIRARPSPKPPVCSRTSRGGRPEAEASNYNKPGELPSPSPGQPPGLRFFSTGSHCSECQITALCLICPF